MSKDALILVLTLLPLSVARLGLGTSSHARLPSVRSRASESHAIALTPDGSILVVVNPDSNSVAILDTGMLTVKAELDVGVAPKTVAMDGHGNRACIACQGSDYVSVVDIAALEVVDTWSVGRSSDRSRSLSRRAHARSERVGRRCDPTDRCCVVRDDG